MLSLSYNQLMITQSTDTHPKAEEIQLQLLRQATPAKRFAIMCSLSQTAAALSRRAIRRANPSYSQQELDLAFVSYHYGDALAEQVQHYLEQRHNEPN